jgi:hypothetical protein
MIYSWVDLERQAPPPAARAVLDSNQQLLNSRKVCPGVAVVWKRTAPPEPARALLWRKMTATHLRQRREDV